MPDGQMNFELFNSVGCAVIVCDKNSGEVVFRNAAALRNFNYIDGERLADLTDRGSDWLEISSGVTGGYIVYSITPRRPETSGGFAVNAGVNEHMRVVMKTLQADGVLLYRCVENGFTLMSRACTCTHDSRLGAALVRLAAERLAESGDRVIHEQISASAGLPDQRGAVDLLAGSIYDGAGRLFAILICASAGDGAVRSESEQEYFGAMCRYIQNILCSRDRNRSSRVRELSMAALVENSSIITAAVDNDLNIIDAAGNGLLKFGLDPSGLIGHSLYEYEYFEPIITVFEAAVGGASSNAVISIGEYWFDAYMSPAFDGGECVGLFAILIDITEKIQLGRRMERMSSSLDVIAFSMRIGFWSMELSTHEITWDEGCYHLWNVRPNEFEPTDESLTKLCPEGDWDRLLAVVDSLMSDPHKTYFQFRFSPVNIGGELRYIESRGKVQWENGEPVRLVGITNDITDSIEMEEQLEYELTQGETMMNISLACAYSEDVSDGVHYAVDESARLLGAAAASLFTGFGEQGDWANSYTWTCERLSAMHDSFSGFTVSTEQFSQLKPALESDVYAVIDPDSPSAEYFPKCGGQSLVALVSNEPETCSFLWIGRAGKKLWSEAEISFVMTLVGVIRMALRRSRMEAELKSAVIDAQAGNRAKSDFLSQMSHEIRTPLHAVLGMAHIAEETNDPATLHKCLKNIHASGEHLLRIINDILDISRIEAGKMELEPTDFSFNDMISNVCNMMAFVASEKHLSFTYTKSVGIPEALYGDGKRLSQVLINLLNNSVKFTDAGEISLSVSADEKYIHFVVSDTGIGIKPDDMERIFVAFERLNDSSRNIGGQGLGLHISKSIIDMMNGSIRVESEYGKGTKFYVDIPYKTGSLRKRAVKPGSRIKVAGINALVVDDNAINLMVTTGILKQYGISCDTAAGGRESVQKAASGHYDIIFMDHMMPDMDGVEACRAIRNLGGEYGKLPIVALTANIISDNEKLFREAGMSDYITKPMNPVELGELLIRNLPKESITYADPPESEP